MDTRYEYSVMTFQRFDPAKKYASFDAYEVSKMEDFYLYNDKGLILCCNGKYYQNRGIKTFQSVMKQPFRIQVKEGKKVIFEQLDTPAELAQN